jgi:hypothetical protein
MHTYNVCIHKHIENKLLSYSDCVFHTQSHTYTHIMYAYIQCMHTYIRACISVYMYPSRAIQHKNERTRKHRNNGTFMFKKNVSPTRFTHRQYHFMLYILHIHTCMSAVTSSDHRIFFMPPKQISKMYQETLETERPQPAPGMICRKPGKYLICRDRLHCNNVCELSPLLYIFILSMYCNSAIVSNALPRHHAHQATPNFCRRSQPASPHIHRGCVLSRPDPSVLQI